MYVIQDMHKKYESIIHINPYELNIKKESFSDSLYASGGTSRKRDKWIWDAKGSGLKDSMVATPPHDFYRLR